MSRQEIADRIEYWLIDWREWVVPFAGTIIMLAVFLASLYVHYGR